MRLFLRVRLQTTLSHSPTTLPPVALTAASISYCTQLWLLRQKRLMEWKKAKRALRWAECWRKGPEQARLCWRAEQRASCQAEEEYQGQCLSWLSRKHTYPSSSRKCFLDNQLSNTPTRWSPCQKQWGSRRESRAWRAENCSGERAGEGRSRGRREARGESCRGAFRADSRAGKGGRRVCSNPQVVGSTYSGTLSRVSSQGAFRPCSNAQVASESPFSSCWLLTLIRGSPPSSQATSALGTTYTQLWSSFFTIYSESYQLFRMLLTSQTKKRVTVQETRRSRAVSLSWHCPRQDSHSARYSGRRSTRVCRWQATPPWALLTPLISPSINTAVLWAWECSHSAAACMAATCLKASPTTTLSMFSTFSLCWSHLVYWQRYRHPAKLLYTLISVRAILSSLSSNTTLCSQYSFSSCC